MLNVLHFVFNFVLMAAASTWVKMRCMHAYVCMMYVLHVFLQPQVSNKSSDSSDSNDSSSHIAAGKNATKTHSLMSAVWRLAVLPSLLFWAFNFLLESHFILIYFLTFYALIFCIFTFFSLHTHTYIFFIFFIVHSLVFFVSHLLLSVFLIL